MTPVVSTQRYRPLTQVIMKYQRKREIDDDELLNWIQNGAVGNELLENPETTIFRSLLDELRSNFCKRYLPSWLEYVNGWATRLETSEILTKTNYKDFGQLATFIMRGDRTLKNRVESILSRMTVFGHKLDSDLSKMNIRQLHTLEKADANLLLHLTTTTTILRAISNGLFALEVEDDQDRIIHLNYKLIDFLQLLDGPQILDLMNAICYWDVPSLFFAKNIKPNLVKSVMGSSTGRKIVATFDSRIFSCLPKEILLAYKHNVRTLRLEMHSQANIEESKISITNSPRTIKQIFLFVLKKRIFGKTAPHKNIILFSLHDADRDEK